MAGTQSAAELSVSASETRWFLLAEPEAIVSIDRKDSNFQGQLVTCEPGNFAWLFFTMPRLFLPPLVFSLRLRVRCMSTITTER